MRAKSAWTVTFVVGMCLVVLVVGVHLTDGSLREGYFNADHVYIATLFRDLTHWGGHLRDWNFTPAPYFFPDMPLYGVVRLLAPTIESAQYGTDLLQFLLVICAARALLRRALPDCALETAVVAPCFAAWALLHFYQGYGFIGPAMVIAAHGGGLLSSLIVLTLCLRPQRRLHATGAVSVALISALTAASDALFVVSCSLPLAATALWYAPVAIRARVQGAPRAWPVLLGRCALGAASGIAGLLLARATGLARAEITGGSIELARETWSKMWYGTGEADARYALIGLECTAIVALLVIGATWLNTRRGGLRVLAFWQLVVSGAVVSAYLYNGAHIDRWSLRYLVTPCNLALIFLAGLIAQSLGAARSVERTSPWPTRFAIVATLALVFGSATQASALMSFPTFASQHAAAECVAKIAEQEGVTAILGEYWIAKPLMLLSDDRAHVAQINPGMHPYLWITSRGWYRGGHVFGIVITNGLDPAMIRETYGKPQTITRCGGYELYIYQGRERFAMTMRMQYAFEKEVMASDEYWRLGW